MQYKLCLNFQQMAQAHHMNEVALLSDSSSYTLTPRWLNHGSQEWGVHGSSITTERKGWSLPGADAQAAV
jgi:hypothetical protein